MPHIHRPQHLLTGYQGLIQLFAVTRTDNLLLSFTKDLHNSVCQIPDCRCIRLLNKKVARLSMLKCERNQIHSFIKIHEEPGHVRVGNGDRSFALDLVDEERDYRATGTHDIAIPGASQHRATTFKCLLRSCLDNLLPYCFCHAHCIDRICSLISREEYHPLYFCFDRRRDHIIRSDNVGAYSLHGEKFAGRYFFQSSSVEYIVRSVHDIADRVKVSDVTNIELYFPTILRITGL